MTYRCTVPGSEHEVEYLGSYSDEKGRWVHYRYRGRMYRITQTTWQRDYVKAGDAK